MQAAGNNTKFNQIIFKVGLKTCGKWNDKYKIRIVVRSS